jgi:hypothetical protein
MDRDRVRVLYKEMQIKHTQERDEHLEDHLSDNRIPPMNTSTANPDGIDVHLLVEDGFDLSTVGREFNLSSREDLERATALTDGKGRYSLHYTDPGSSVVHEDEISRIRSHVTKLGRGVLATQVDLLAGRMYRGSVDKVKGYTLLQIHTFIQLKVPFVAKRADDWIRVRTEIV